MKKNLQNETFQMEPKKLITLNIEFKHKVNYNYL